MRNDLPSMNAGRAMAQASHASNQFVYEFGKNSNVKSWQEDANGFGTVIVLSAKESQIISITSKCIDTNIPAAMVFDPTYGYILPNEVARCIDRSTFTAEPITKDEHSVMFFRNELTCGYVFLPENSENKEQFLGELSLHP